MSGVRPQRSRGLGAARLLPVVFVLLVLVTSQLWATPSVVASGRGATTADPAVPLTQSLALRFNHYQGYEIDSFSNSTTLEYGFSSDVPVSVALMTGAQYNDWASNATDPVSNSVTYSNGTTLQNSVTIGMGQYFLMFFAYSSRAVIKYGFEVDPSTPYSYGGISPPLAMGVASFGIYNKSGVATSYQIQTNEIAGLVNISSVQVDTRDAHSYGVSPSGFTVQLNAMLVVNDGGATSPKVYWVQNVPDFETAGAVLSFGDEVWNSTDPSGFLSNQTITSTNFDNGGYVYTTGATRFSSGLNFYSYSMNNVTYSVPLKFGLLMTSTLVPGTGVMVQVGYRLLSNGSAISSPTVWFDNITIHDPTAQSAYFEVSGSQTPPTGLYYDAELVFAGEGNLEPAYFTSLTASLDLFYQNGNSGSLSSFPSYYGFSGDTGESATDLVETYTNGVVHLSPGANPAYPYLGNASLYLDPSSFVVSASTGGSTTTSTGVSVTTSSGGTTSSGTSAPAYSAEDYLLEAAGVVVVVILVVAVLLRLRRPTPPPTQGEPGLPPQDGTAPPPPPEGGAP
jgi:thermopsin